MEPTSTLGQLELALEVLEMRYRSVSREAIREQALDVLCLARPDLLAPTLVIRLVEARLLAML